MMKKAIPAHKRLAMGGEGNIPLGYARGGMVAPVRPTMTPPVRSAMPTPVRPTMAKAPMPVRNEAPPPMRSRMPMATSDGAKTMPIRGVGPSGGGAVVSKQPTIMPIDTGPISRAPEMMKRGGSVKVDVGSRSNVVKNPLTAARAGNGLPGMKSGGKMGGKKC